MRLSAEGLRTGPETVWERTPRSPEERGCGLLLVGMEVTFSKNLMTKWPKLS